MITDKICYIHLRNQRPDGHYEIKGGATIAWLVESTTGDIIIGKPARCMADNPKTEVVGDVFRKSVGRAYAYDNLVYHSPQFIVRRDTLVWLATQQALSAMNFPVLSPSAFNGLADYLKSEINANVEGFMNSNWYEQIVRMHFHLHPDNRLELATAAADKTNIQLG